MLSPVEQIKAKLSIVDVVGSYLKLEKAGVNHRARCPFHAEKTPSFFVSPSRDTFHCFGCSKGGDIFTFVQDIEGADFKEALSILATRAGVELTKDTTGATSRTKTLRDAVGAAVAFYQENFIANKKAKDYLGSRGVNQESIELFAIGSAPSSWDGLTKALLSRGYKVDDLVDAGLSIKSKDGRAPYDRFRDRIMFPIFDAAGRAVGFTGRVMPGADTKQGKYVNSPETALFNKSKVLYGLSHAKHAIREGDKAYFVEGQLDVILAHQAGTKNVVAASGTALSRDQLSIVGRFSDNVTFILDGDDAGFSASNRSVKEALSLGMYVNVVAMPEGSDPADIISENEKEWQKMLKKEMEFVPYALDVIKEKKLSGRERNKAVAEFLYPYVNVMYNEIEKDEAFGAISDLLGVSREAVRADFDKWHAKSSDEGVSQQKVETEETIPIGAVSALPPRLDMVTGRLFGLLWWQEGKRGSSFKSKDTLEDLKSSIGEKVFSMYQQFSDSAKQDKIFEAEAYYGNLSDSGGELTTEAEHLLHSVKEEILKYKLTKVTERLKKAEKEGDSKEAEDQLKQFQDITNRLHNLKNN